MNKKEIKAIKKTISVFDKAIVVFPNEAIWYDSRGLAKFFLGDYESAVADFDKTLELDPDYVGVHYHKLINEIRLKQKGIQ